MRTVDKTKKSNIKCEHCKYWIKGFYCYCSNEESPKYKENTWYYNRCKGFEWRENRDASSD